MKEENLENLFAAARRVRAEEVTSMPAGFAQDVLREHQWRVRESRAFFKASILSIATALIILGAVIGINFETSNSPIAEEQESTVEMAYALWDSVGN